MYLFFLQFGPAPIIQFSRGGKAAQTPELLKLLLLNNERPQFLTLVKQGRGNSDLNCEPAALHEAFTSSQKYQTKVEKAIVPARAHVPQLMVLPKASEAKLTASGFAAMAVINIADEMVVVWKQVSIR